MRLCSERHKRTSCCIAARIDRRRAIPENSKRKLSPSSSVKLSGSTPVRPPATTCTCTAVIAKRSLLLSIVSSAPPTLFSAPWSRAADAAPLRLLLASGPVLPHPVADGLLLGCRQRPSLPAPWGSRLRVAIRGVLGIERPALLESERRECLVDLLDFLAQLSEADGRSDSSEFAKPIRCAGHSAEFSSVSQRGPRRADSVWFPGRSPSAHHTYKNVRLALGCYRSSIVTDRQSTPHAHRRHLGGEWRNGRTRC